MNTFKNWFFWSVVTRFEPVPGDGGSTSGVTRVRLLFYSPLYCTCGVIEFSTRLQYLLYVKY